MTAAPKMLVGTPTRLEARMVLTGRGGAEAADAALAAIFADPAIQVIEFTTAHLAAAIDAFDRYGKGRHPAGLNYGDCMAYAVARVAGCPLLYKGEDFARTDIRPAH
jgi:ribonuclease VapC